jgi:hypothetical protein
MTDTSNILFESQRSRMIRTFKDAGRPFLANTMPYHSSRVLWFNVVNVNQGATRPYAYAVARQGQLLEFFGYGVGEDWVQIPGVGTGAVATEAETNLGKAKSTNGAQDFVIEGVGFHCRGLRMYLPQTAGQTPTGGQLFDPTDYVDAGQTIDPSVFSSFTSSAIIMDPGGIVAPPQMFSPFNLEQAMFQAVMGYMSLVFEWDRRRTEKITITDLLTQAGGSSYLRSNGEPSSKNRYCIDEGYLWRRDGETDSEFISKVRLENDVVIPIDIPTTPEDGAVSVTPSLIGLDLTMRLYGLTLALRSAN